MEKAGKGSETDREKRIYISLEVGFVKRRGAVQYKLFILAWKHISAVRNQGQYYKTKTHAVGVCIKTKVSQDNNLQK